MPYNIMLYIKGISCFVCHCQQRVSYQTIEGPLLYCLLCIYMSDNYPKVDLWELQLYYFPGKKWLGFSLVSKLQKETTTTSNSI